VAVTPVTVAGMTVEPDTVGANAAPLAVAVLEVTTAVLVIVGEIAAPDAVATVPVMTTVLVTVGATAALEAVATVPVTIAAPLTVGVGASADAVETTAAILVVLVIAGTGASPLAVATTAVTDPVPPPPTGLSGIPIWVDARLMVVQLIVVDVDPPLIEANTARPDVTSPGRETTSVCPTPGVGEDVEVYPMLASTSSAASEVTTTDGDVLVTAAVAAVPVGVV